MAAARVLVGLDGSDDSLRALRRAIEIARAFDGELIAVHALGLLGNVAGDRGVPTASHRGEIVEAFEHDWCAPLADAGVDARRIVRDGTPVDVLLAVANDEDVDFIVVASRGIGGAAPTVLGSTSRQLATRSTRPVVIVPAR